MSTRINSLDQKLDIAGSRNQSDSLNLSDEGLGLGSALSGQTGSAASIVVGAFVVVSGLTGMTPNSVGNFLSISGADSGANNGNFLIVAYNNATSINIQNPLAITDINNGSISWVERNPYSLEDDLNYIRTDRASIKGLAFDSAVPDYQRPTETDTDIPANLSNIAGKTTDAKALVVDKKFENALVSTGNGYITIVSAGNLPHANAIDRTGVPILDGIDAGNYEALYVGIIDASSGVNLTVLDGPNVGHRVLGLTRAGASTDGDSVEVVFYSLAIGAPLSSVAAYTWELGQPTTIDLFYGYRQRLDNLDEAAIRFAIANGAAAAGGAGGGGGISAAQHAAIRQLVHLADGVGGPFEQFLSGAYREIESSPFPTSVIWWESELKLKKIVEKTISRNSNKTPSSIEWKVYDTDGSSVLATVTDSVSYSGVFETNRTRNIS